MTNRKRILNVTSRKKQDNMMPAYTNPTSTVQEVVQGPITLLASDGIARVLWNATQRSRATESTGNPATVDDMSTRTATTCFMSGLKERVMIETSGSGQWIWRRICFTFTSPFFYSDANNPLSSDRARYALAVNPQGWQRALPLFNTAPGSFDAALVTQLDAYIFKGTEGFDWTSPFLAKTHGDRVNIKFDKTFQIRSQSDASVTKKYNLWHPMKKNLVYDEDEEGGIQGQGSLSANIKGSMGDYYVYDLFRPALGTPGTEQLQFNPSATLYWHER